MLHNLFFMEQHFLLWLQDSVRNPMLTKIFVFITSLGNGGAFWILLSLGLMIPKKTRKAGTLSLLSLACCAIVTNVCLKNLVAVFHFPHFVPHKYPVYFRTHLL